MTHRRRWPRFTRGNCLLFGIWMRHRYRRKFLRGERPKPNYWAERPTRHIEWRGVPIGWHWVNVIPRRHGGVWMLHYEPRVVLEGWKALFHKIWFKGRIRRYDEPWKAEIPDEH